MTRAKSLFRTTVRTIALAAVATAAVAFVYALPSVETPRIQLSFAHEAIAGKADVNPSADWDLANLDNKRVDMWVQIFSAGTLKDRFGMWLERKSKYEPMISAKLAERDMPQDLIYLAMIESGFNPKARSRAQAGGLWQFISETGQRYGLTVNKRVDERNNPEKATEAALAYLSDLHDRFGSWYLAAAAYNTGENRVGRIMRTVTGKERGTDADYYRISPRLPRETRDYVPMMIAAARIAKEPVKYGFAGSTAE